MNELFPSLIMIMMFSRKASRKTFINNHATSAPTQRKPEESFSGSERKGESKAKASSSFISEERKYFSLFAFISDDSWRAIFPPLLN
jgi:hypothetical protein